MVAWWDTWFVQPTQSLFMQLALFLPQLLGALLVLLVGWLIAKRVEQAFASVLKSVGLDKLADRIGLAGVLSKGGIRRKLSELIGAIIYWLIILAVVLIALNALQLTVAAQLFQQIVEYLPNVVAAVFILIVGIFAAAFLATTVRTAASNAGIAQAHLLGQLVQTIVIVSVSVTSLQQLQIQLVGQAFLIILGAVSFGLALAFGLGCKDLVGRYVSDLVEQLSSRKR